MFTLTKKTYAIKSWIALSSLAAFSACEAPVQNQSFLSTAPAALPQHIEEQALSCIALSTSLVGLSDTAVSLNGNASVSGSVVLLGSSTLNVTGNAIVKDGVYVRSDASVRASGHANSGVIHEQDFTSDEPRLLDFARSLDRLTSTQVLSGLSGSVSLSGNGGINVIEVDGDVNLAGQDQLTLGGGANDIYVFNVRGSFLMSGQANVLVSDSMLPGHVLFYLGASSTSVSVTGKGHLDGTVFAPNGTAQISGNGSISGLVIAKDTLQVSGNGFTISPAPFCPGMFLKSPVPAPTPTPTGVSPTPTPTPTDVSPTPTPTPTDVSPTPTPTPTDVSPTPTPTPTDVSPTPTPTPTGVSPTPTPTPTSTSIPDCMGSDCSNPIFGV